jgi:hypothetical protein
VDLFEEVRPHGELAYGDAVPADVEGQANLLVQLKDDAGLDTKEVADAFADVANAMLVSLSDRCVEILDNKDKLPKEEAEAACVAAVTALADYALSAASIFGKALPGTVIENGGIKYNGKAKKNKLETLFYNFMKANSGMNNIKAMLGGGDEPGSAVEDDAINADARMGCLQHIFSISQGKRSGFEQRLMNDMFMGMMKGEGGDMGGALGDLSNMFQSAGGAGAGENAAMNEDLMREMMSGMSGGMPGMPGMPGGGGGMPEGAPDPEMFASMARELKMQLAQGTMGKQQVLELEKDMGMDIGALINLVKMAKTMSGGNSKELQDIIETFEMLAKLKK